MIRKTMLTILTVLSLQQAAFGFGIPPQYFQQYQQPYMNTYNYWGQPWGMQRPMYFYPQLPFHGMWMPQQYPTYFQPHGPSPYAPYYQCPTCGGAPYVPPVFPQNMIHPGGGVS